MISIIGRGEGSARSFGVRGGDVAVLSMKDMIVGGKLMIRGSRVMQFMYS